MSKDTITAMIGDLSKMRKGIMSGRYDHEAARDLHSNTARTIGAVVAQIQYARARKEKPSMGFMKCQ